MMHPMQGWVEMTDEEQKKERGEKRMNSGLSLEFGGEAVVARGHSRVRSWVLLVLLVFLVCSLLL